MKRINFGVCLKLAVFAGLVTAPCSRAEDKGGEPATVYDWDSVLNAYIPREICKESDKCECGGGGGDSGGGGQSATADPALKCVQMDIGLGAPRYSALSGAIVLQLNELQASSRLYSPDGFHVVAGYTVHRVSRQTNGGGVPKWVQVSTPSGVVTEYVFADGESVGVSVSGREDVSSGRLAMVDAQGWASATDPAFYDYYPGDGSRWRFGAAKGAPDYLGLIEHQTPQGRVETKQDMGLEMLRDIDGALRQVATPARLADFVVRGQDAYDLTVYPNDASCVTGSRTSEGYYQIVAGAVPEVVWKFRNPTPGTYGVLEVTREMPGSGARTWRYEYVEAVQDFVLRHPGGIKEERVERIENDDKTSRTVRRTELGPDGVAYSKKELRYETHGGSLELVASVNDPGGLNLTTAYDYYTEGASVGLERMSVSPDGSWTRYEYDGQKRKTAEIRPWLDAPTNAPVEQCAVTRYGYGLFAPGDFLTYNDQRPRTEIKEICGIEVSRTYHAYPTNALGQAQEIKERAAFPGAPYGHASNPRTVKSYYAATAALPLPGRLATVVYPGGSTETYGYEYGTFNASTFAFTPDPDGGAWRETVTIAYSTTPNSSILTSKSTRRARVWDERGREVLDESYVEDGAAFALIGWKRMSYDRNGKLTETAYSDGRVETATWGANCCGKESETAADGTVMVYGYNLLKQKISETKKGLAADGSGDITTLYTYDLENRLLSTAVTNTASGLGYVAAHSAYDAVGRVTNVVDRLGNPTATTYAADGTVSITRPNGVVDVTEWYLDGQTKRVLENGVVKHAYAYGVNPDGTRWTLSADGSLPAIAPLADVTDLQPLTSGLDIPWQLQAADTLGRSVATYTPGFGGTVLVNSNAYDIANNLLSSAQYATSPNPVNPVILSKKLYSYAANGSLYLSALDLNTNGLIDVAGIDRITGSSSAYEKDAANTWWKVSRSWVYPEFNSSAAVTTSVNRVLLTGLGVQQGDDGVLASYSEARDVRGNATVSEAFVDRVARRVTQVTSLPTSMQPTVQISVNGLLQQTVSSTAVTNSFGYDLLGRRIAATDGRGNTTIMAYNTLGQVVYTEDAATNRSSYAYDPLGRRVDVTDALGNVTHTRYDTDNRVVARWGATYPALYTYDAQGRMVQLGTYRGLAEITDHASLLALAPSFDKTRWFYDNPTGLLTNKLYADGKGPSFTYTTNGSLAARLWAGGMLTSYTYDAAGLLASVDYADETPDIAYAYDRRGNLATVTDASGTRTFTRTPNGQTLTDALQFQNEVFTLRVAYDAFNRCAGYSLSNTTAGAASLLTGMTQTYDAFGRISEVAVADTPAPFRYGYLPGSDLQQSLTMPNGVTRQTAYDPQRDVVTSILHTNAAGTVLTLRTFAYDAVARLTNRTQHRLGDDTNRLDAFGYNTRSELTAAALGTNTYAYSFDPIGNRQTASELCELSVYGANGLNQYTAISNQQSAISSPTYDLDGNQTLIHTTTGIWHVSYNAENRPFVFSNNTTVVEIGYDYLGRRFDYKVTVNGAVIRHERYLYRGYLQIAALVLPTLSDVQPRLLRTLIWDATEPIASRPLCLQTTNDLRPALFYFSFDQLKSVTEIFDASGTVAEVYNYTPFGTIKTHIASATACSPLTYSSEVFDEETGLIYFNYRYYNPADGRWLNRDMIGEFGGSNIYLMTGNDSINQRDILGLSSANECTCGDCEFKISKLGELDLTKVEFRTNASNEEFGDIGVNLRKYLEDLIKDRIPIYGDANKIADVFKLYAELISSIGFQIRPMIVVSRQVDYEVRKCKKEYIIFGCCQWRDWEKTSEKIASEEITPESPPDGSDMIGVGGGWVAVRDKDWAQTLASVLNNLQEQVKGFVEDTSSYANKISEKTGCRDVGK